MRNRLLSIIKSSIPYIKELRPVAGSVTAVILWQQLDYWFEKYPDGFFKFMSPPEHEHSSYKAGDSWSEEMGFSEKEFRDAFDKIGLRYSSKTLFNKTEKKFFKGEKEYFFASYQDKLKKMTFYYRNHEKADAALDELVRIPSKKRKSSSAENSKIESIVDDQRAATHLPKGKYEMADLYFTRKALFRLVSGGGFSSKLLPTQNISFRLGGNLNFEHFDRSRVRQ